MIILTHINNEVNELTNKEKGFISFSDNLFFKDATEVYNFLTAVITNVSNRGNIVFIDPYMFDTLCNVDEIIEFIKKKTTFEIHLPVFGISVFDKDDNHNIEKSCEYHDIPVLNEEKYDRDQGLLFNVKKFILIDILGLQASFNTKEDSSYEN